MRIKLYLTTKLLSFRCVSKNICPYFKYILETDTELTSNSGKFCFLVQECTVDNCHSISCCLPSKLKVFARCQKIFLPSSLLFAALGLQHFCLTWYATVLPPQLLKLGLRCLPLYVLGSHHSWLTSSWLCFCLQLCLCSSSLLQDKWHSFARTRRHGHF